MTLPALNSPASASSRVDFIQDLHVPQESQGSARNA